MIVTVDENGKRVVRWTSLGTTLSLPLPLSERDLYLVSAHVETLFARARNATTEAESAALALLRAQHGR